jgi:hypothetical protein
MNTQVSAIITPVTGPNVEGITDGRGRTGGRAGDRPRRQPPGEDDAASESSLDEQNRAPVPAPGDGHVDVVA